MSTPVTLALALIGAAGLATATVGILLPDGRRLEVLLALVAGAGAGIASIAIGLVTNQATESRSTDQLFLVSTLIGTAVVAAALVALWVRSRGSGSSRTS